MKKIYAVLSVLIAMAFVLSACGQATPTEAPPVVEPTAAPPTEAPPPPPEPTTPPYRVGFVTDTAGIADKSFNQTQWEGVQRAGQDFGIDVQYAQSTEASQYTPNLTTFASEGYDLVIAAGFFLAGDLASCGRAVSGHKVRDR